MEICGQCGAEANQTVEIRVRGIKAELSFCAFHFDELVALGRPQACSPLPKGTRRALRDSANDPTTAA